MRKEEFEDLELVVVHLVFTNLQKNCRVLPRLTVEDQAFDKYRVINGLASKEIGMIPLEVLKGYCEVLPNRFESGTFILKFHYEEVVVSIRIIFEDEQSGAELVITNMTTLPTGSQRRGFGSKALQIILELARLSGIRYIQAVQVQLDSEIFWVKNGFVSMGNITNDFRYIPKI